jgi:hypothetical protein
MADTGIFRLKAVPQELQWWADRGWTGGIDFSRLAGLEQFVVRTRNTTYELTVLSPCSGEVLVRGGRVFPAYTRAHFAGSSLGGSFLKLRALHAGFLMEFIHDGQRIVTTRVKDIATITPPSV